MHGPGYLGRCSSHKLYSEPDPGKHVVYRILPREKRDLRAKPDLDPESEPEPRRQAIVRFAGQDRVSRRRLVSSVRFCQWVRV